MLLCCMTKLHWMDSCITTENNRNHIYLFVCMHVKAKCIYKWLVPFFCFVNHLHNTIHTHTYSYGDPQKFHQSLFSRAFFYDIFSPNFFSPPSTACICLYKYDSFIALGEPHIDDDDYDDGDNEDRHRTIILQFFSLLVDNQAI